MIIEIKIPTPGESITEVELASWLVEDGSFVEKDQELAEVESDKATLPLLAEKAGKIEILIKSGETVKVGSVACKIDTSVQPVNKETMKKTASKEDTNSVQSSITKSDRKQKAETPPKPVHQKAESDSKVKFTPLAKKIIEENNLSVDDILQGLKKITTREVNMVLSGKDEGSVYAVYSQKQISRSEHREKMSQLRKKLSARLVSVKNETAMLTTFNEVDMSRVIDLRKNYQKQFVEKHNIKLGFMSFFVKATTQALKAFPKVNSMIDGEEIVTPDYVDIAIAVQTDKGLMVPVIRNTETMGLAEIEKEIANLAEKARKFRLSIDEMSGGTFTITNGGVFGSMLSTPILNPPQSGILGMHNIVERPVAINGKVEVRPVMYIALSYDHRIIDGRDSVSFLVRIKELIESPERMLFEGGQSPDKILLGLD